MSECEQVYDSGKDGDMSQEKQLKEKKYYKGGEVGD